MSSPPWMPLAIDDYLADTAHLSLIENGAYMALIMRYWKDGGLPSDERMVARYSRMSADQWAESRDVLAAFFDDGWHHKRIDAELAKAAEIIGKRKSAAEQRHGKSNARAEQVQSTSTYTGVPPSPKPLPVEDRPQTQQPLASRGRADLVLLESRLREAGDMASDVSPGLLSLAPILGLLDAGHDLEADILPTIKALAARAKRRPKSWDYFTEAIKEASAKRRGLARGGLAPPIAAAGGNIFDQFAAGLRNGSVRNGGGDGATIDAVPRLPDRSGFDERDDAEGIRGRDRRLLAGGAH